jgi:hypothetical protein
VREIDLGALRMFDGDLMQDPSSGVLLEAKDVFINLLGKMPTQNGRQAIAAYILGQKLFDFTMSNSTLFNVEDAELELMKVAAEANAPNYIALVMGQIHERLAVEQTAQKGSE